MNMMLKKIYSVFDPRPLHAGQQALFVDLDALRGDSGVVRSMAGKICLADRPTCQVLAGHRGSGKSTELWRLRQKLEEDQNPDQRFFVVQVQADDELDRNDIDFPEILIAMVRQVAQQLRERENIELKPGYFQDRWERLKDVLASEINFEGVELATGMATLSATIKNSPEARQKVREALEPDTNNWLHAANDILGEAILQLTKKGYAGLVVIIDDLDKMITRSHASAGCSTTEYLFIHRSAQLTAFQCHLIYTLPIELAYSHHEPNIKRIYGGHLPVVPMAKIVTHPPTPLPHEPGMEAFRNMIRQRLVSVGATERDLFRDDTVRDDLIRLTGGQPTELMSLTREALVSDGLPIGPAGVQRCRTELMRGYRRLLRKEHWPLLEEIRRTGQVSLDRCQESACNETAFRELLDSRTLLLYRNDEEWYGVNPAINDLEPPGSNP